MDRSVAGEQNTIFIPEKEDMAIQTKYAPFLPPSFPAVFPTFLFFNKQTNKQTPSNTTNKYLWTCPGQSVWFPGL